MSLSPPAEPRVLARRIYFDLLGLPPRPEDVQRLSNACDEAVYEGHRTYYLSPTAEDLDFSLLMAGDMLSPFVGEEDIDARSDAFSQWIMNLAYEEQE